MSDAKPLDTAAALDTLHAEAATKPTPEAGVAHYLRGAMGHILDLLNLNDWMGARRAAEEVSARADATGKAVTVIGAERHTA